MTGIVSTGLQCGTRRCPTDELQLNTLVRITIEHSDTIMVRTLFLMFFVVRVVIVVALGTVGERQYFRNTMCIPGIFD